MITHRHTDPKQPARVVVLGASGFVGRDLVRELAGQNVATLPLATQSTFIRSFFDRGFYYPPGVITPDLHSVQLLDPIQGLLKAFAAGEITTYQHVVAVRGP